MWSSILACPWSLSSGVDMKDTTHYFLVRPISFLAAYFVSGTVGACLLVVGWQFLVYDGRPPDKIGWAGAMMLIPLYSLVHLAGANLAAILVVSLIPRWRTTFTVWYAAVLGFIFGALPPVIMELLQRAFGISDMWQTLGQWALYWTVGLGAFVTVSVLYYFIGRIVQDRTKSLERTTGSDERLS